MRTLLTGAVLLRGENKPVDIAIEGGIIVDISPNISAAGFDQIIPLQGCFVFPGFVDVHVHLREPGFFYKETIKTGTLAAARGGYTAVCAMPNVKPPPDSLESLAVQREIIARDAVVPVYPYATITVGQEGKMITNIAKLAPQVIGFSDDGKGVQSEDMMRVAMKRIAKTGKVLSAHCEDESLLYGGCIHQGEYAARHRLPGICSASEWKQVERDLHLAEETGCKYHICHVSAKESVALIRAAKARGVNVTCETAPHYLLLCDEDLQDDGRFKMNPPIRSAADRDALIEGLLDGTIDMIATDHAPHSAEEKSKGLRGSIMGIVGLETAFPLLYEKLVLGGVLPLAKLIELLSDAPRKRLNIPGGIEIGKTANLTAFNLNEQFSIDPETFASLGKSTPFTGWQVHGLAMMTVAEGEIVWRR